MLIIEKLKNSCNNKPNELLHFDMKYILLLIVTVFTLSSCSKSSIDSTKPEKSEEVFAPDFEKELLDKYSQIVGISGYKKVRLSALDDNVRAVGFSSNDKLAIYILSKDDKATHSKIIDLPPNVKNIGVIRNLYVLSKDPDVPIIVAYISDAGLPSVSAPPAISTHFFYGVKNELMYIPDVPNLDTRLPQDFVKISNDVLYLKQHENITFYEYNTGKLLRSLDYWYKWDELNRDAPFLFDKTGHDIFLLTGSVNHFHTLVRRSLSLNNGESHIGWKNDKSIHLPIDPLKIGESANKNFTLKQVDDFLIVSCEIVSKRWDGSNNLLETKKTVEYTFNAKTGNLISQK